MNGVTFENCVARSTAAGNSGGAIYVEPHKGGSPTLTAKNCVFKNNMVNNGTTGRGGAVGGYNANIVLENCTFSGNKAGYGGAVAAAGSSNLTVKDCTFEADNDGAYGGDDIYIFDGYTFYKKKTMAADSSADSSVNYDISGNTHKGAEGNWKDYNVVKGRVLGSVSDKTNASGSTIEKTCAGSGDSVFIAGHDLTFASTDYDRKGTPTEASDKAEDYTYVLMNIPYDKFYAAELKNDKAVDTVSSATKQKTRASLSKGSYHVSADGSSIDGAIYPVMIKKADLEKLNAKEVTDSDTVTITTSMKGKETTTEYKGKDALFEAASYSYYKLTDVPSYYKVAAVGENDSLLFAAAQGIKNKVSDISCEFTTNSRYGDYEIDFDSSLKDVLNNATVYGVIVSTDDGTDYGMRHLENIWHNVKLAWSTGYVTTAHGSPLQSKHYKSMMGKTINEVTYLTSNGIYVIPVDKIKVPEKYAASFTVGAVGESLDLASGSAAVTIDLPADIEAEWSVSDAKGTDVTEAYGFSCVGKTLTWDNTKAVPGNYTLKVTDKKGKYADTSSASFLLATDSMPAAVSTDCLSLVKSVNASDADFNAFVANIQKVKVNDKEYNASGKGSVKVINEDGTLDLTSKPFEGMKAEATYNIVVTSAGYNKTLDFTLTLPETIYGYASLSYEEYWANEGVYAADNADSLDELDSNNEYDKGGFDAVSRATVNHGLHRGSFQQTATIYAYDADGNRKEFELHHWSEDGKTMYFTDGSSAGYLRGVLTVSGRNGSEEYTMHQDKSLANTDPGYQITGIKYVPVAVSVDDYADFCKAYTFTPNGAEMAGGYSEGVLKSYTETAYVDEYTNGLKDVKKNGDSWSFSKRKDTGTSSGIKDKTLKKVDESKITAAVRQTSTFGDFIRLDLNGNAYGDFGSSMQTVRWDYYGNNDPETSTPLASYGTKFAADNWMHKSMGIQLGLTDSYRCELPKGYTGTGTWVVTVYALGYEDYSVEINVTENDIHGTTSPMTTDQKTQLQGYRDQAKAALESEAGVAGLVAGASEWKTLEAHYKEVEELLASEAPLYGTAAELIEELPVLIKAVQPKAAGEGTLTVNDLNVTLAVTLKDTEGNALDTAKLVNAKVTVISGSGKNAVTVIDKADLNSSVTGTLSKSLAAGTECDVTITSDNYQNITFKVNAVIKTSTAETQDAESTSETPSSVSEVLKIVEETGNEKASENAESASNDAEKSDAPAAETAPAAAEETASAGQTEGADASGLSAE